MHQSWPITDCVPVATDLKPLKLIAAIGVSIPDGATFYIIFLETEVLLTLTLAMCVARFNGDSKDACQFKEIIFVRTFVEKCGQVPNELVCRRVGSNCRHLSRSFESVSFWPNLQCLSRRHVWHVSDVVFLFLK